MKRCFNSLKIREMQIKTTPRYHFSPIRLMKIFKYENNFICETAEKQALSTMADGNAHWYNSCGGEFANS